MLYNLEGCRQDKYNSLFNVLQRKGLERRSFAYTRDEIFFEAGSEGSPNHRRIKIKGTDITVMGSNSPGPQRAVKGIARFVQCRNIIVIDDHRIEELLVQFTM